MDHQPTETLLRRYGAGDAAVYAELVAHFGDELGDLARGYFRRIPAGGVLQPTVLVNEVWLRLVEREDLQFDSRRSFFAFCSRVMRNLLVDAARASMGGPDEGSHSRLSLADPMANGDSLELIDLDRALRELEIHDAEAARLVELRFFGGLDHRDVAAVLGVSESTVDRRWRFARAWLRQRLESAR